MTLKNLLFERVIALIVLCALLAARADTTIGRSAALSGANNSWTPIGPQFSAVLALERNPDSDNVILAATNFGGVYRSEDYGFTWSPIVAGFSTQSIFSISYANSYNLYLASFGGGVYRSTDGGTSFTQVNSGLTDLNVQAVAADPAKPATVLIATSNGGVFRTVDGGNNWTQVFNARGKTIVFDTDNPGEVYLGTIGQGLFKSTDGGLSFHALNSGLTAVDVLKLRFGPPPSRTLYAATNNGAFMLAAGSNAWTDISGNLPSFQLFDLLPNPVKPHALVAASNSGVYTLADDRKPLNWLLWNKNQVRVLAADPSGSVFHVGDNHGIVQATVDGGQNWLNANYGIQNLFVGALGVITGGPGPSNSIVFAGSDFGVHRRTYVNWETFQNNDQGEGVFDIQFDPTNPKVMYIGKERTGVWKSVDGGGGWLASSTNLVPSEIYSLGLAADGNTVYAGTSSGLYRSSDNGASWVQSSAAQLGIALSVAPDPTRGPLLFVGGPNGQVMRSDDGGLSFQNAANNLPAENIVGLVTAPWEKTYAITASGGFYATSDNGLNWFAANSQVAYPALSLAADPARPWILYMGTNGGGIYKSVSGSLNWVASNNGLTSPFVFSIAVDPAATDTVYAGTADGVFKSVDGAVTWTPINKGLASGTVTAVLVGPANSHILYASVSNAGVFQSLDSGQTWTAISTSLPHVGATPLAQNPLSPAQLFAGTRLNGVYRSSDNGGSWQQSSTGMSLFVRGLAVDPVSPATVYAGSLGAGVFKSTDAGANWLNKGLLDQNIFKLAIDPQNHATVYAATSLGLNRSVDNGENWRLLGQRAAFVYSMVVDNQDRNHIYIGTTAGRIFQSKDGGDSWDAVGSGLPSSTVLALAVDAADGSLYAAIEGNGIWKSANANGSWVLLSAGTLDQERISALKVGLNHRLYAASVGAGLLINDQNQWTVSGPGLASPNLTDIELTATGTLLAATFDAGIFRSVDNGASWVWAGVGLTANRVNGLSPDPGNPGRVYAATADGVFISNDDGQTWQTENNGIKGVPAITVAIDPYLAGNLYLATNGKGVYELNDSPLWQATNAGLLNLDIREISFGPQPGMLYAATLGGGIARSRDGGQTWFGGGALPLADIPVLAVTVDPTDIAVIYAGTGGYGVVKTVNGGIDWTPVNNGIDSRFILSLVIDKQNSQVLYAGTADNGVFYTNDAGNSWHPLSDSLFNHVVTSLAIDPGDSSQIYAGTEGGGVFFNQVSLPGWQCQFMVSANGSTNINATAGEIDFTVDANQGCDWGVETFVDWISVGGGSQSGPGVAKVSAAENKNAEARSGLVIVAGRPMILTQDGNSPNYRLSVIAAGQGSGTVSSDVLGIRCGVYCQQLYPERLAVTLQATPAANSTFIGWEGDPECVDGKLVMASDSTCIAVFQQSSDLDGDGLPDQWESQFGIDTVNTGGANDDPDHDGISNLQEFFAGTNPNGLITRYFAAGVVDTAHGTRIGLYNPTTADAHVLVHLTPDTGVPQDIYRFIPAGARTTIDTVGLISGGFAVSIESDQNLATNEVITQIAHHTSFGETAAAAANTWYVTGSTLSDGRSTLYSIFNPDTAAANVQITYLPVNAGAVIRNHAIAAGSRLVVDVAQDSGLSNTELAAVVKGDRPLAVESTINSSTADSEATTFASSGLNYLLFLGDLYSGLQTSTTIEILNPTDTVAQTTFTYFLTSGGIVQKTHAIPAFSQIAVNPGDDDVLLKEGRFGVAVNASAPLAMSGRTIWNGPPDTNWIELNASAAKSAAGTNWAVGEGFVDGLRLQDAEIDITNVTTNAGSALIQLLFDDGSTVSQEFNLVAVGQTRINLAQAFPATIWKTFSLNVTSLPGANISAADIIVDLTTHSAEDRFAQPGDMHIAASRLSSQ